MILQVKLKMLSSDGLVPIGEKVFCRLKLLQEVLESLISVLKVENVLKYIRIDQNCNTIEIMCEWKIFYILSSPGFVGIR
jgi:hypothetical protein